MRQPLMHASTAVCREIATADETKASGLGAGPGELQANAGPIAKGQLWGQVVSFLFIFWRLFNSLSS